MREGLEPPEQPLSQKRGRPAQSLQGASPRMPVVGRSRARISDLVYEELCESIRSLRLPPGAPLSEPAVAAWLNVSRAPVREAFTRLADQQLINIVPQVGSQVAPIAMTGVKDAVFVRCALEQAAFSQAIALDSFDAAQLQRIVDRNREAALAGDAEGFFETDDDLHQQLFAIAGVERTWQVVRGTKIQLDRLRRLNIPSAMVNGEVLTEHQEIVDALRRRDALNGAAVIYKHSHRILTDTASIQAEHPEFFVP